MKLFGEPSELELTRGCWLRGPVLDFWPLNYRYRRRALVTAR